MRKLTEDYKGMSHYKVLKWNLMISLKTAYDLFIQETSSLALMTFFESSVFSLFFSLIFLFEN
jgi:hypothetical protein